MSVTKVIPEKNIANFFFTNAKFFSKGAKVNFVMSTTETKVHDSALFVRNKSLGVFR